MTRARRVLALSLLGLAGTAFLSSTMPEARAQVRAYTISTVAGNGTAAFLGDGGAATSAELYEPCGLALDKSGALYIADQGNYRIRKISGGNINTVAGNGTSGYTGDGKAATSAEIATPCGVVVDSAGNLYIADGSNHVLRKVDTSANISTFAGGNTLGFAGDTGLATNALLNHPTGLAVDSSGVIYICDSGNNAIRKVGTDNYINTIAGGRYGYGGDGSAATSAALNNPEGVAVDSAGNIYIADTNNSVIRKVTKDGIIQTIAGTGTAGFSGDGGLAVNANLNYPKGLALDAGGTLYFVDSYNHRVRAVSPSGIITTIAGTGRSGFAGDGGNAAIAQFSFPFGLALDASSGNLWVADAQNNRIRLLAPTSQALPAIRGTSGVMSAAAFGGFASVAPGSWIEIYGTGLASNTRSWTKADFTGFAANKAPTSLDGTKVTIGGKAAFVSYISSTQVNAQVPADVDTSVPQPVVVTNGAAASAPYSIAVNDTQPGLLAPPAFNVGGKQYVVALFTDGVTYVAPVGAIAGVKSRPAKPGETIVMYGIGFGPVTQNQTAGVIVSVENTLQGSLQMWFGSSSARATLNYQGLAPTVVGLYQFNVVVPNVAVGDAVPVGFMLNGTNGTQTLYTAVGN